MEHRHPTRENAEGCSSQTCPGGPPACSRLVLLSILECELKMQNKTLSIICQKLRRDILHSQNKTHAPSTVSGVLCDLLPLVHVTSSPSAYLSFPQLCSNKTSPPHPGAMVLGEAVVGASVRTTLPGSQHQRQWLSVSKSPIPGSPHEPGLRPACHSVIFMDPVSHLMPSTSTVPGTQQAFNKYLWIKDQKLQKSEDWKDLETRVSKGCRSVSGRHHSTIRLPFHPCGPARCW